MDLSSNLSRDFDRGKADGEYIFQTFGKAAPRRTKQKLVPLPF